jgi:OmpA-OmpF porin, OOP family
MLTLVLWSVLFADVTPPRFELDGSALKVPGPVVFETGSEKLKPESDPVLAHVEAYLRAKDFITLLRIEVHSDAQGSAQHNQLLSEKRALAVGRALVARGINCMRLIAVGFGETKPIAPNTTPEGRAQNRRTVFVNAALKGRPIGGAPVDGGGKVAGDLCRQ